MSADAKSLTITEKFPVPVGILFNAWVDAAVVKSWMAPGAMKVGAVQIEPKPSGDYLIEMKDPAGDVARMHGKLLAVDNNQRLQIQWRWDHMSHGTELAVEFHGLSECASEMRLTQSGFQSVDEMQNHQNGWKGCFEKLAKAIVNAA